MRQANAPRVLIGFREVSGFCRNLRDGLEAAGATATFIDLFEDPRGYGTAARQRGLARLVARLRAARASASGPVRTALWTALYRGAMSVLFVWAVARYDVFIFRSSNSFFGLRDLPLLKRLGKRVIHVYLGSDSRPSYLNGAELGPPPGRDLRLLAGATRDKVRLLRRVERYADVIVSHPPSSQLHVRPFVSFLALGLPYPAREEAPPPPAAGDVVQALHAPTDPLGKGSHEIRSAVERLQDAGVPIALREVRGVPNAEVLRAIEESDFVIDQLYSDTPMATFAAEAASRGRPAVVGGYGWDRLRGEIPTDAMPPAQLCQPRELDSAIRQLVEDRAHRLRLGAEALAFVQRRWSPAEVAGRYLQLVTESPPSPWMIDPATIRHVEGAGLSEEQARETIRQLVSQLGSSALALDENPAVREALLGFAGVPPSEP